MYKPNKGEYMNYLTTFQIKYKLQFKRLDQKNYILFDDNRGIRLRNVESELVNVGGYGNTLNEVSELNLKQLESYLTTDTNQWDID